MNRMKLTICSRTVLWKICSRISVNSSSSSGPISMSSMVMVAVLTNVYFDEFFSAVFTLESAAAANRFAIKCSNTNIWCKFKASLSLLRLKNVRTRSHELTHWNNWLETGWWLVFLSFFLSFQLFEFDMSFVVWCVVGSFFIIICRLLLFVRCECSFVYFMLTDQRQCTRKHHSTTTTNRSTHYFDSVVFPVLFCDREE